MWTRVQDRLPDEGSECIAAWYYGGRWWQEILQFRHGRWWGWNDLADEYDVERKNITHWQPKSPDPPRR